MLPEGTRTTTHTHPNVNGTWIGAELSGELSTLPFSLGVAVGPLRLYYMDMGERDLETSAPRAHPGKGILALTTNIGEVGPKGGENLDKITLTGTTSAGERTGSDIQILVVPRDPSEALSVLLVMNLGVLGLLVLELTAERTTLEPVELVMVVTISPLAEIPVGSMISTAE